MFRITHEPLHENLLRAEHAAGGYVSFIGRVRDHNEGRAVLRLEYEAYEELAVAEGERILRQASQQFEILAAACRHRVGSLEVGDAAIQVEVAAAHRREAFEACQFIVDEVKARVPIWKKEHYADGNSGWIGVRASPSSDEGYYSRQVRLPEVGADGQGRLRQARVLVVGAGGLGCAALQYLAAAGVGTIGICEPDVVEESNLHRQPLYTTGQIGQPKVEVAAQRLRLLNPHIKVVEHRDRLTRRTSSLCQDYDILIDCTDNFAAKFLLNEVAVSRRKTLISASIYRLEGQVQLVVPGGPCLRCLWPDAPEDGCVGTCEEVGVLGFVPGLLGVVQAAEAIKQVLGLTSPLAIRGVWLFDLLSMSSSHLSLARDPACPVCGSGNALQENLTIEIDQLDDCVLVDIRDAGEASACPIPGASRLPLPDILAEQPSRPIVLVCSRGVRSLSMAQELRRQGISRVYSLAGGARAVPRAAADKP